MPCCIVKGCSHKSGQKSLHPDVILHQFPHSKEQIKKWLLQTGQFSEDLDMMTERIIKGLKQSSFRMCSMHFEEHCYMMKNNKKVLKPNAVPTIFPTIPRPAVLTALPMPTPIPPAKRKRVEEEEQPSTSQTIIRIVSRLVTTSTQTKDTMFCSTKGTMTSPNQFSNSVGIQNSVTMKEISTQTKDFIEAEMCNVTKDHTYPVCFSTPLKQITLQQSSNLGSPIEQSPSFCDPLVSPTKSSVSGHAERSFIESSSAYPKDSTFEIQEQTSSDDVDITVGSLDEPTITEKHDCRKQRKFIVYEKQLDMLLNLVRCQHRSVSPCNAPIIECKKYTDGSMLKVKLSCLDGHDSLQWNSQPMSDDISIGNVALASCIILVGYTYQRMKEFFNLMNIPFFSHTKSVHFSSH
ncbi:uncharacterized protein LOC108714127 [Xenopus laevis]|uniref:Uncharacterized protein LOC108714127 n=1 Tax=Xenopus laevis TaxID=8355 RepID=A0A8J0V0K5_XENLA|nr:uncharacterized protein LOC108714127 [Xenopus laevis]